MFPPPIWRSRSSSGRRSGSCSRGRALAALTFAIIAVSFTGNEEGPFFRRAQDDGLLLAQSFSAIVGLTGLILAIVTYQRRQAERRAQHLAHDLQAELLPLSFRRSPSSRRAAGIAPA